MRHWLRAAGVVVTIGLGVTPVWAEELTGEKSPAQQAQPDQALAIGENMSVQLEYVLTADGQVVDSTDERAPFTYVHGQGQIIPGLERQLAGLKAGTEKEITVAPEEGYGPVDPDAFVDVPKKQLPAAVIPEKGQVLQGVDESGQPFRARVHEVHDKAVTLDLNHPLAGKTLLFKVKILSVTPAPR
ncbi:MAG: peptidylprolyl isomerase [Candidatus Omnitrophica bacterium]|nr:peptidylprolyl isomerase [Candidatus Omnitrophota bacterium]